MQEQGEVLIKEVALQGPLEAEFPDIGVPAVDSLENPDSAEVVLEVDFPGQGLVEIEVDAGLCTGVGISAPQPLSLNVRFNAQGRQVEFLVFVEYVNLGVEGQWGKIPALYIAQRAGWSIAKNTQFNIIGQAIAKQKVHGVLGGLWCTRRSPGRVAQRFKLDVGAAFWQCESTIGPVGQIGSGVGDIRVFPPFLDIFR